MFAGEAGFTLSLGRAGRGVTAAFTHGGDATFPVGNAAHPPEEV